MNSTKSYIVEIAPSAARTVTGNSATEDLYAAWDEMLVYIDVTAVSGTTPTLTVTFQNTDGNGVFYTHTVTSSITAAGQTLMKLTNIGHGGRFLWTIGGTTPSFTFSIRVSGKRFS